MMKYLILYIQEETGCNEYRAEEIAYEIADAVDEMINNHFEEDDEDDDTESE